MAMDIETALEDGKKPQPVEAPDATDRDTLVKKLRPALDEDDAQELATRVLIDYRAGLQDREEWETRLAEGENAYYNRVDDKTVPWEGCANFHVPITMMGVETFKPRLVEGVLGQDPPVFVVPTLGASESRRDLVELFLNWQLKAEIPDLEETVTTAAHLFLQPGIVIAKTTWQVTRQWRKYLREFPAQTPLPTVFDALFGDDPPAWLDPVAGTELEFEGEFAATPQGGAPLQLKLTLAFLEDDLTPTLQVLVEREEVIEHPAVDLVDPPDLIAPVKGGGTIASQPWIIQRHWLYEDDLRAKVELKIFDADAVQAVLDSGTPKGDQPTTDSERYREGKDAAEGVEGQGPSNVRRTQYEILEGFYRYDIDDDGRDEEIIVWVSPHAETKILGWDYLDNVYAHGRRPLRVGRYFPIPFRFYGLAFSEVIRGIQDEVNTIHNQRVDYATIQNAPFFFYRASSSMPPILQSVSPGEGIPLDNPQQDVVIPKWQGSPTWGQSEEAMLMQQFERLTGLTDLSVGKQPNRVGATRTAAGTQTLLSESGLRFKNALAAFQRFWAGVFEDVLALDQAYLPPKKEFRVTGRQPTVMQITDRTEIRGRYQLRLASSTETMNRQKMRDDATVLMQATMNPTAMQAGLISYKGLRRVYEKLYKAFGEDPAFYLEDRQPIRSPEEELQAFVAGNYLSPVAGEDTQHHLMVHQQQVAIPYLPVEVRSMLMKHMAETQQQAKMDQLAAQMQAQQGKGQRPPVGQQAQNAQTGAQPQPSQPSPETPPQAAMPQGTPA